MKNIALITFLVLIVESCLAQAPNWSVNPNDFQHSMTFTTFLNVDGRTLTSENDRVAAFIDNQLTGVANVTYVASRNKYVAYLTVFSNSSNKPISFKIYDSINDVIVDVDNTVNFIIDANIGGIFQSFSIAQPALNNQADVNSFSFKDVSEKSINITENKVEVVVPANTILSELVAEFMLSDGAKAYVNKVQQESGTSIQDYTIDIILTVLSEDESVLKEYEIKVKLENTNPTLTVDLSSTTNYLINQNLAEITLVTGDEIASLTKQNFTLVNATIQSINKTNSTTFSIKLIALSQGDFSIQLKENTFLESDSKLNEASNTLSFTLDSRSPYITSIQRKQPQNAVTNSDNLEFIVEFSEAVENVLPTSFTSVSNAQIQVAKDSDSQYTVSVSNISDFNGQVGISLKATNTITDLAGNSLRTSTHKNY